MRESVAAFVAFVFYSVWWIASLAFSGFIIWAVIHFALKYW